MSIELQLKSVPLNPSCEWRDYLILTELCVVVAKGVFSEPRVSREAEGGSRAALSEKG